MTQAPTSGVEEERGEGPSNSIDNVITVMSGKGGVGKTTVAVHLAVALARRGLNVGIMDADIHGPNVPKMLGVDGSRLDADSEGIIPAPVTDNLSVMSMAFLLGDPDQPVIWRGPIKMGAIKQFLDDVRWGDLDVLVVDLPPGTGDEPLSIAQLVPHKASAIIVSTPQDLALLDSRKAVRFAEALKMPVLGIVENMSGFDCPHCGEAIDLFKTGGGETAAVELKVPFLGRIPIRPSLVGSADEGTALDLHDGDLVEPLVEIAMRVEERLGLVAAEEENLEE